jgi:hypothetical protein
MQTPKFEMESAHHKTILRRQGEERTLSGESHIFLRHGTGVPSSGYISTTTQFVHSCLNVT